MSGARAEPCVAAMSRLKNWSTNTIGINQYFFRTRKNRKNSMRISSLLTAHTTGFPFRMLAIKIMFRASTTLYAL